MKTIMLIGLALATLGCHRRTVGHFGDGAFYHARGHYRVRYMQNPETLLPARWSLTNFANDARDRPTDARLGAERWETIDAGWLGASRGRRTIRVPLNDLRYTNGQNHSEIWARTMVIPRAWRDATPETVMRVAVAAISDPRIPLDPLGLGYRPGEATVRRFGDARVDGRTAHWVELDIAERSTVRPNRYEPHPASTAPELVRRVTLVAVRPGTHEWQWRRNRRFPMMVVFGFSSPPEEHESVRSDFAALVRRVDIAL